MEDDFNFEYREDKLVFSWKSSAPACFYSLPLSPLSPSTLVTINMMMLPPTNMTMGKTPHILRRSLLKMCTSQLYCHNEDIYRWRLATQLGCLALWISYQVREFVCTVDRIPGAIVCMHCEQSSREDSFYVLWIGFWLR